ncbi:MAG TPA: hypothetical protein GXZ77_04210 [Papillibacter sp.]|nr:hypothetical protein [Papillibacter sp.]
MKKLVAIALVLLIALSLFGCGRMVTYDDDYTDDYNTRAPGINDGTYNPAVNGQYDTPAGRGRGYNVTDPADIMPDR